MKTKLKQDRLLDILSPLMTIFISMAVTSTLIMSTGSNPLSAFYHLFIGAFSSLTNIINTTNRAVPIAFAAFAVALSNKVGLFNIGVEGQLLIGSLASAAAGAYITGLPMVLHLPICLLTGMLFGMLYALPATLMFVGKRINMLVINLLMNSIATMICTYFIAAQFANDNLQLAATPRIQPTAQLPNLLTRPNKLHIGFLIVLFVAALFWFYYKKTTYGYQLRIVGDNRDAARYAGIHVRKYYFWVLMMGGALAGLAGSVEVTGNFYRMFGNYSPGYGFDGIPIAILANGNPFGIIFGSVMFGVLRVGAMNMQAKAGVSSELVKVIQGVLIVLIAAQYIIRFLLAKLMKKFEKRSGQYG